MKILFVDLNLDYNLIHKIKKMTTVEASTHIMNNSGMGEHAIYAINDYGDIIKQMGTKKLSHADIGHNLSGQATSVVKIGKSTQQLQNTSGSSQLNSQSTFNVTANSDIISSVSYAATIDSISSSSTVPASDTIDDLNADFKNYRESFVHRYDPSYESFPFQQNTYSVKNGGLDYLSTFEMSLDAYKRGDYAPDIVLVNNWGFALLGEVRIQINGTTVSSVSGKALLYHAINNVPSNKSMSYLNASGANQTLKTASPLTLISQPLPGKKGVLMNIETSSDDNLMSSTIRGHKTSVPLNWPTNNVPGGGITNLSHNTTMRQITIRKSKVQDIISQKATAFNIYSNEYHPFKSSKCMITDTGLSQNSISVTGYSVHSQLSEMLKRDHDQAQVLYLIETSVPMTGQTCSIVPSNAKGFITSITVFTTGGSNYAYSNQHRDKDWFSDKLIVRRMTKLLGTGTVYEAPVAVEPISTVSLIVGGNSVASTTNKQDANLHSALTTEIGGPQIGCTLAVGTHLKPTMTMPQSGISTEQQQQITITVGMTPEVSDYLQNNQQTGDQSTANTVHAVITCANVFMTDREMNSVLNVIQ